MGRGPQTMDPALRDGGGGRALAWGDEQVRKEMRTQPGPACGDRLRGHLMGSCVPGRSRRGDPNATLHAGGLRGPRTLRELPVGTRGRAAGEGDGPPCRGWGNTTYFLGGPYLCAGIRTGCGDAGTARSRGRFRRTPGSDTCSLSFLLSRDLKATTGVKRVNAVSVADERD